MYLVREQHERRLLVIFHTVRPEVQIGMPQTVDVEAARDWAHAMNMAAEDRRRLEAAAEADI